MGNYSLGARISPLSAGRMILPSAPCDANKRLLRLMIQGRVQRGAGSNPNLVHMHASPPHTILFSQRMLSFGMLKFPKLPRPHPRPFKVSFRPTYTHLPPTHPHPHPRPFKVSLHPHPHPKPKPPPQTHTHMPPTHPHTLPTPDPHPTHTPIPILTPTHSPPPPRPTLPPTPTQSHRKHPLSPILTPPLCLGSVYCQFTESDELRVSLPVSRVSGRIFPGWSLAPLIWDPGPSLRAALPREWGYLPSPSGGVSAYTAAGLLEPLTRELARNVWPQFHFSKAGISFENWKFCASAGRYFCPFCVRAANGTHWPQVSIWYVESVPTGNKHHSSSPYQMIRRVEILSAHACDGRFQ